jgi:hypothetical protein
MLLNYDDYRARRNAEERQEYMRSYMKEYRKHRKHDVNNCKHDVNNCKQELTTVNHSEPRLAQAEAEAEAEAEIKKQKKDFANSPYFSDPEFTAAFESFKASSRANHHWDIAETTAEAWLMELANLPVEEATKALRFSTACGSKKPITNGDHNRKPSDAGGKRGRGPRVSFEDGLLT